MADTADLVVLGAFYGQGSKGGMMSIFLMGCYDPSSQKWCTVTKCAGGHDDATLARLQKELDMVKISKDPSKIPSWLKINKIYYPLVAVLSALVLPPLKSTHSPSSGPGPSVQLVHSGLLDSATSLRLSATDPAHQPLDGP
ncbi:hypothetical protein CB1_000837002 [Camelus ferus]|nr:hypothetical protein CB1_000837002 [Camelus ferus]